MKQLRHDTGVLDKKLKGEFELYGEPEKGDVVDDIQDTISSSIMLNTPIQYGKYTSYVYGRRRCNRMEKRSRLELIWDLGKHRIAHKEAYTDLRTAFKALGGVLA